MSGGSLPRLLADPRHFQIAILSSLLVYGQAWLGFGVRPEIVLAITATALATQALLGRWIDGARFEPRSALISALSLCLLLRTESVPCAAVVSLVAIGSKFAIRRRGDHVFNPTAFALALALASSDRVWISPGQWGSAATLVFGVAALGGLVVHRAERSDVTLAFLASYAALLFARAVRLGDPLAIPLHQLESGALLIFAFFMISDPRTTPDARIGRIVFAAIVALAAIALRFRFYQPNALVYALVACTPVVPMLDRIWRAPHYVWPTSRGEIHHGPSRPLRLRLERAGAGGR
jgi:Na+-transporting NADH:ubiquinone oxidoreductase subunit NqrB